MIPLFDENWPITIATIVAAGMIGTFLMTFFLNILSTYNSRIMSMHLVLRTMLTFGPNYEGDLSGHRRAVLTGYAAHYGIGVMFMFLYYTLWRYEIVKPDLIGGIFLGAAGGVVAIIFWYWFFVIHPNPPAVPLRGYFINVFLAHFVFALSGIVAFNLISAMLRMLPATSIAGAV